MRTIKGTLLLAVAAAALSGCAYHVGSQNYSGRQVGVAQSVSFGIVESVRPVEISLPPSGVGTASGAMLGTVAGSHVGGGSGQIAGAIGGALLGGIIGTQIEADANRRPGVEVTVMLDSGQYIAIVQEADEPFRAGDRVRILSGNGTTRVTH
jgi:outer membrane lipoprotein SlyB